MLLYALKARLNKALASATIPHERHHFSVSCVCDITNVIVDILAKISQKNHGEKPTNRMETLKRAANVFVYTLRMRARLAVLCVPIFRIWMPCEVPAKRDALSMRCTKTRFLMVEEN